MNIEKKLILIVSIRKKPAIFLKKILLDVLDKEVYILVYSFEKDKRGLLDKFLSQNPKLIIASGEFSYNKILDIASDYKILKASRDVSEPEFFDRLFLINEGKKVLVINETKSGTLETINALESLGMTHLKYIPYWLGCTQDYSSIDTAISPGMLNICPPSIPNKIDIGMRKLSIPCFIKILNFLDLDINNYVEKYLNEQKNLLIRTYKKLSTEYIRAEKLKNSLQSIINGLDEPIISVNNNDLITEFNFAAENLLGRLRKDIINKNIYDVFTKINNTKNAFSKKDNSNKLISINDKQFYVSYHPIYVNTSIDGGIYTFKEVEELQKKEEQVRRILYKGTYQYKSKHTFNNILIYSEKMKNLTNIAKELSSSDSTILITGESGTGKELFAQSIHNMSPRKKEPFVAVNFAAINDNLIESELFGYEEGAFTGAKKSGKKGLFELAHNGTIFLDEIGDSSLWVQSRLLRVLEEKEIMRLGDTKIIPVNVRVIVATNKNLKALISEGKFREDLYYRLNVFKLRIPPLRERKEDIMPLINFFMNKYDINKKFINEAYEYIVNYDWPGNIRELKNMVEYLSVKSKSSKITKDDLPIDIVNNVYNKYFNEFFNFSLISKLSNHYDLNIIKLILQITLDNNHSTLKTGRKGMKKILKTQGIEFTDAKIRTLLEHLKSNGLVNVGVTRQGTTITEKGESVLREISQNL